MGLNVTATTIKTQLAHDDGGEGNFQGLLH